MKVLRISAIFIIALLNWSCSSIMTNQEFYAPVIMDLKQGNYSSASKYITNAEFQDYYADKDRLLLYLDKGITLHYSGDYHNSNEAFHKAEYLMDSLYTKSISKGITSFLLNDNSLDYSGEVYEDLYINIFKVLNYIHLSEYDEAYVEVQRISDKLKEQNVYYKESIAELNKSEDAKVQIESSDLDFYNDALANYLSHLIYRAEGESDNSRISLEQASKAWGIYPSVYNYEMPEALSNTTTSSESLLNIIAFTGNAPYKHSVGARITTFDDWFSISDPTEYYVQPIPFPGMEGGWNFKFEFPEIYEEGTNVYNIEVYIDGEYKGNLELLENIANVATKTFEVHKKLIFFKTAVRAVTKGIASGIGGKAIKKEVKDETLGNILAFALNLAVDATEHADLRSWQTIPGYSFTGEIPISPGNHDIEIRFLGPNKELLKQQSFKKYNAAKKLNIVEAYYLD